MFIFVFVFLRLLFCVVIFLFVYFVNLVYVFMDFERIEKVENVRLSMKLTFELDGVTGDIVNIYGSPVGDVSVIDLYNVLRCLRLSLSGVVGKRGVDIMA